MRLRALLLSAILPAALLALPAPPAHAATWFSGTYSNSQGSRYYEGFVPSSYQAGVAMPLVVGLHGCTQEAEDLRTATRFNALAEEKGFLVVYPQQTTFANSARCWNWMLDGNQQRGYGEPSIIAGITNLVRSNYAIDPKRIYVFGLSAGGAMTTVMGATYPDIYAAMAVHAGCEFDGYPCGSSGGPSPTTQGNAAYSAMGSYKRVVPVQVWHGTSDTTVYPINGHQVLSQWAQTNDRAFDGLDDNDIDDVAESVTTATVSGGRTYDKHVYRNAATGANVMEKYMVRGMGHAYSGGCGCEFYTDPYGPDATRISYAFFLAHPKP